MRVLTLIAASTIVGLAGASSQAAVYYGVEQVFNGGFSSPSRQNVARVYQVFLDDANFSNLSGPTEVNGLSFRLPGIAETTYPIADISFSQYEISIGAPSAAAQAAQTLSSTTFADNFVSPTTVRTGALIIPAGSFTDNDSGIGDDTPAQGNAEFSFFIPFATPVVLSPGTDYVMLIRHGGYTSSTTETQWNFDSLGYTNGSVVNTSSVNGTSGGFFSSVNKFAFSEVPEPSSLALLGGASLMMLRRRRV